MSRPASCKSRKSEIDETLFGNILNRKFQGSTKKHDAKTAKIVESVRKGDLSSPDLVLIGEGEL